MEERKRDYQIKTYSKYHLPSSKKNGRDYKICGSDKKYSNNQQTKPSYVWNKRIHKTWGGCPACKRNESADLRDENRHRSSHWKTLQRLKHQSCNQPREIGKARQEKFWSPHFWGDFSRWATTDSTRKGNYSSPPCDERGHGTKQEKIYLDREWEPPPKRVDLSPWKQRLLFAKLGKYRWTPKWKTRKCIQNALKNKVSYKNQ